MEGGGRKEEKEGVGEGKDNQQLSRSRRMKTEAVSAGARVQIGGTGFKEPTYLQASAETCN